MEDQNHILKIVKQNNKEQNKQLKIFLETTKKKKTHYKNWSKIFERLSRRSMKKTCKFRDYKMMYLKENLFLLKQGKVQGKLNP